MDDDDIDFAADRDHLYKLMEQAVPRGVQLPPRIEAAAANVADVPSVGVRWRDRCREILNSWPEKVWPLP